MGKYTYYFLVLNSMDLFGIYRRVHYYQSAVSLTIDIIITMDLFGIMGIYDLLDKN